MPAASRMERSGAGCRRQVRHPEQARTGIPPHRPHELADARTATGHDHQIDEGTPCSGNMLPAVTETGMSAALGRMLVEALASLTYSSRVTA